jgi:hypothetical protein
MRTIKLLGCLAIIFTAVSCGGGGDGTTDTSGGSGGTGGTTTIQQEDAAQVVNVLSTATAAATAEFLKIPFFMLPAASVSKSVISCVTPDDPDIDTCSCSISEAATICDATFHAAQVCSVEGSQGWSGSLHAEGTQTSGLVQGNFQFWFGEAPIPCADDAASSILGQLTATISGVTTDASSTFDFFLQGDLSLETQSRARVTSCAIQLHIDQTGADGSICGMEWPPQIPGQPTP